MHTLQLTTKKINKKTIFDMLVNARFGDFEHYFQNFQVSDSWMGLAIPVLVFSPALSSPENSLD